MGQFVDDSQAMVTFLVVDEQIAAVISELRSTRLSVRLELTI